MLKEIQVTVSGNVTREPELKHRKTDGRPFTVVAIAVNDRRFDRGTQQWVDEGVTYYDIICGGTLGANVLQSVGVGTPVVAHGKFRVHEWSTDTMRGARPSLSADSLGIDLTWGTTVYTKGSAPYPVPSDGYEASPPPPEEGGPVPMEDPGEDYPGEPGGALPVTDIRADEDGVADEDDAESYLRQSA